MKINIYYGGRGLMDDPTLYVLNKIQGVLEELNVIVTRYHLQELKHSITTLPQTLKDVDGIILATTVEWYGIGGNMQQLLDAFWLYADKERISKIYMQPIVMSTTYGEREAKGNLAIAWEILGGHSCSGLCGYIADVSTLEMSDEYTSIIEKKAESLYRAINQKITTLPASNQAVKKMISTTKNINLTPQESEQLSLYVANDEYVQTQKEDILELSSYFKVMLGNKDNDDTTLFVKDFMDQFKPQAGVRATYKIALKERSTPFIIKVEGNVVDCYYGECGDADVEIQITSEIINDIIAARMTFQRAFMGGSMKMKGDFKILRTLDLIFPFMKS